MTTTLKANYTVAADGKIKKLVMFTEVEVTAQTDEDSLMEVIEAMDQVVEETYGLDSLVAHKWNSSEIFRIADRM